MTAVSAWLDMMRQTVSVQAPSSKDVFGNVTHGSAVSYRARIVGKRRLVINGSGQEVVSHQTVYLATASRIDPQSKITLSTGDVGSTEAFMTTPPILATAQYPDESGHHHSVVYL